MTEPERATRCPALIAARPQTVILIVAAWDDNPIAIHELEPGRSFCLGDEPGDFHGEFPGKPRRRWPVVSFEPETPGVAIPGRGRLEPIHTGETRVVVLGDFRLTVSRIAVERRRGAAALVGIATATLLCFGAALSVALTAPSSWTLARPEVAFFVLVQPFVQTHAERELSPPPPEVSPKPTPDLVSIRGTMHCGETEMGQPKPAANGRYGVMGPIDNPDPHIARDRGRAPTTAAPLLTLATELEGADPDALTMVWGRDDALGQDPESERGRQWADELASAKGRDGSGVAPVEGGLSKRIEWLAPQPRVIHAGLGVAGAVRPSTIARVMATRFGRLQECHGAPGGRLELRFDVTPAGAIEALGIHGDLRDDGSTTCLRRALEGLEFPSSLGKTSVVYPLFVRSQGNG